MEFNVGIFQVYKLIFQGEKIMELCINEDQVRELSKNEINLVSGGLNFGTGATGIFSAGNVAAGIRLAGGIGLVYSSYRIGWDIGGYLYSSYNRYKYNIR